MFVGFHHFSDLSGWLLIRRFCGPQSIRPNHKGGYWSTLIRWCNTTDRMNFVFLIKEYTWCFHGTHRSDIIRMRSIVVLPLTFYNSIALYDMTEAISILDLHFFSKYHFSEMIQLFLCIMILSGLLALVASSVLQLWSLKAKTSICMLSFHQQMAIKEDNMARVHEQLHKTPLVWCINI